MDKHNKPQVIIDLDEYNELLKRPPVTGDIDFPAVIQAIATSLIRAAPVTPDQEFLFREIFKNLTAAGISFTYDRGRSMELKWKIDPAKFPIKQ